MKSETRETKWAVLLSHENKLSKGNSIMIKEITACALHGGSYLETEIKHVTISDVKKIAPNMLLVGTDNADYYMYCYNLSDKSLCVPANEGWYLLSDHPEIGKKLIFERSIKENSFKPESLSTNPVFKIDVIYKGLQIAWCKDSSVGMDIGYVVDIDETGEATTGNYYWLWNTCAHAAGQDDDGSITVDLAGKDVTKHIRFVPKRATSIGENTLIEGEDGNFYIRMLPMDRCWCE